MALCIECSPAVQEVPGSIRDCDALITSRSGPSLLSSECSPMLYAADVGGPGQDPPPPSFFTDLQGILSGRTVLPTQHHSTPAPQQLPEDLLLAKHVLVRRDGHVPPLAAAYDGPFLVLERFLRYFKLQVGNKEDTFFTLRLRRRPLHRSVIAAATSHSAV
jgi:hypothetical protein